MDGAVNEEDADHASEGPKLDSPRPKRRKLPTGPP